VIAFALGVLVTLTTLFAMLYVYPTLATSLIMSLWQVRASNFFVWAIYDTYLRQKGWRSGPRMGRLTRQTRRRIERLRVQVGLV
jgi:hypothetical protein